MELTIKYFFLSTDLTLNFSFFGILNPKFCWMSKMKLLFIGFNVETLTLSYLLSGEHEIVIYSRNKDYPIIRDEGKILVEYKNKVEEAPIEGIITNLIGAVSEEFDTIILSGSPSEISNYIKRLGELESNHDSFVIIGDGLGLENILANVIQQKGLSIGRIIFDVNADYQESKNILKVTSISTVHIGYTTKHKNKKLEKIGETLNKTVKIQWHEDIRELIWERAIIFSALGGLSILLGVDNEKLKESKYAQELLQKLLKEGETLARRMRMNIINLYRTAVRYMNTLKGIKEKIISVEKEAIQSNIDYYTKEILNEASKYGLKMSHHELLYMLLKAYEELR